MICLVLNIVLGYLKKTVYNLFTITTGMERALSKKPSETLNKILKKYLRKSSILVKLQAQKKESSFM